MPDAIPVLKKDDRERTGLSQDFDGYVPHASGGAPKSKGVRRGPRQRWRKPFVDQRTQRRTCAIHGGPRMSCLKTVTNEALLAQPDSARRWVRCAAPAQAGTGLPSRLNTRGASIMGKPMLVNRPS